MQRCSSELAKFKMVKPRQHSATLPDKFPERHVQKPRTVRTCLRARRMMMALQGVTPKENGDDGERCKSHKHKLISKLRVWHASREVEPRAHSKRMASTTTLAELTNSLFIDDCWDVVDVIRAELSRTAAAKRAAAGFPADDEPSKSVVPPRPTASAREKHRRKSVRSVPPRPNTGGAAAAASAGAPEEKEEAAASALSSDPTRDPPIDPKWRRSSPLHVATLAGARHHMQSSPLTKEHRHRVVDWTGAPPILRPDLTSSSSRGGGGASGEAVVALTAASFVGEGPRSGNRPMATSSAAAIAFRSGAPNRPVTKPAAGYDAWQAWDSKAVFPWPATFDAAKHQRLATKVLQSARKAQRRDDALFDAHQRVLASLPPDLRAQVEESINGSIDGGGGVMTLKFATPPLSPREAAQERELERGVFAMPPRGSTDLIAPTQQSIAHPAAVESWVARMATVNDAKALVAAQEAAEHKGEGWDRRRERRLRRAQAQTSDPLKQHQWHVTVPKPFKLSNTNTSKVLPPKTDRTPEPLRRRKKKMQNRNQRNNSSRRSLSLSRVENGASANTTTRRKKTRRRKKVPMTLSGATHSDYDEVLRGTVPWNGVAPIKSPLSTAMGDDPIAALSASALIAEVDEAQVIAVLTHAELQQQRRSQEAEADIARQLIRGGYTTRRGSGSDGDHGAKGALGMGVMMSPPHTRQLVPPLEPERTHTPLRPIRITPSSTAGDAAGGEEEDALDLEAKSMFASFGISLAASGDAEFGGISLCDI